MVAQKKAASKKPAASTKPVWQKLFIRGGAVALIGAPPGYDRLFTGGPAKVSTRGTALADTVVLFAKDTDHLEAALPGAIARLAPGASLWIAYRKGGRSCIATRSRVVCRHTATPECRSSPWTMCGRRCG